MTETELLRDRLVRIVAHEVCDPRVLSALRAVPRHAFVPEHEISQAYGDYPLPIGYGATISQPTVVGLMSEALELSGRERVLEVGTGSGYQAAVLSRLTASVDSVEIVPELAERAERVLRDLGFTSVRVHVGDGNRGVPEFAPYDRILGTAATDEIPDELIDQLVDGGLLVLPVGPARRSQRLERHRKRNGRLYREDLGAVRFVPMHRSP